MSLNPLLDFTGLPRFAEIRPEHISPAIAQLLSEARHTVAQLTAHVDSPSWENFVDPLTDATERLSRLGRGGASECGGEYPGTARCLQCQYRADFRILDRTGTEPGLLGQFKAIEASPDYAGYNAARQKIIQNDLRDFRLSGAELPEAQRQRYAAIQSRLAELSARFEQNVMDATDAFSLYLEDASELDGVPEDALALFAAAAQADEKPVTRSPCSSRFTSR
jgi:oligopeptidase A